jgi:hypothetical protein
MNTPDEVVQQRLAEGLDVTGQVAAGVYGDPAGASAPPAELDLSKAAPTNADVDALRERLAAMEAAQAAAAAAAAPAPEEADPNAEPALGGSVAADVREAIHKLHERLVAGGL